MVVRLRLQRFGRTHSPFYRMVAANARAPRDGKFLEIVSFFFLAVVFPNIPQYTSTIYDSAATMVARSCLIFGGN
jgi:ribosomal protein S16